MKKPIIFISGTWKFFGYLNSELGDHFESCPKLFKVSPKGKISVLGPVHLRKIKISDNLKYNSSKFLKMK